MLDMQASLATMKNFMTKHVQTIPHNVPVAEGIRRMAEKNVGSLVVVSGKDPIGILSERDLVSRLTAKGRTAENTMVADVMSGEIIKFNPDESLKEAARVMNSRRNRLLVFDEDRMTGIITATDIVRAIHEMPLTFNINRAVMKSVYTLKAETSLKQTVEIMTQLRIGSVIITADGEPDGIFTEWDLVRNVLGPHLDLNQPVGGQASRPLITAEEGIDGKQAADIMTVNHIKRLPLTIEGAIVGIITARDLVEAFANS
jgi:CBS domain-containing protein